MDVTPFLINIQSKALCSTIYSARCIINKFYGWQTINGPFLHEQKQKLITIIFDISEDSKPFLKEK